MVRISLLICLFFTLSTTVFAQTRDNFTISAEPEFPKELEQVTLTLSSFTIDLQTSRIVWRENGVVVGQEIGLTQRSFSVPRNGSFKTIVVEATTNAGFKSSQTYTLAPQSMDVLWEAINSHTPPFYKGKALPSEQSLVRVVALPAFVSGGTQINPSQIVYSWTVGGRQPENASGFGKSSTVFKFNPIKNSETVRVLAETVSGSSQAEETISLRPFPTDIVFYEASPLLGVLYDRAFVKGVTLVTKEITLVAEPYFFTGPVSALNLVWSIDGNTVNPGVDKTRLTLRNPDKTGNATISLAVRHVEKTLQRLKRDIQIYYEN
jgi:hypothetical protein